MSRTVDKYLRDHADPAVAVAKAIDERFRHVVVVPACDETGELVEGIIDALSPGSLLVVVVNASDAHDDAVHRQNAATTAALREQSAAQPLAVGVTLGRIGGGALLLLDRASVGRRLPPKRGVGLARKIGCDIALALRAGDKLDSRWIHTTDADVSLSADYFAASDQAESGAAVLTYPFEHTPCGDEAVDRAHAIYEIYLRYYVHGLRWAGSPYAHFTVGSTLAIDAEIYAAVRGMPSREAGEDFYLVNKASKLGAVLTPACEPFRFRSRRSRRVPFGTGPATAAFAASGSRDLYDPRVFALLRAWLAALQRHAHDERLALSADLDQQDAQRLERALEAIGALGSLDGATRGAPQDKRHARLREWFDGFRTLKLIHALRDDLPDVPWTQALARAPFVRDTSDDPFEALRALAR